MAYGRSIRRFIVGTALGSGVVLGAQGVAAQEGGASEGGVAQVQEVVVTAQRRAQRLQDVPMAITALGAEQLEASPVEDISDIFQVVPAVSGSANSSAQPLIAVRGIVNNDFSIGGDPALGIYIDEVYTGRSAGAIGELIDIERVEVVKGPQGTLFGRNTTAGAISIVTPKPSFGGVSGRIGAAYGNYDQSELSAVINAPLSEQVAFRASAIHRKRDGVFDNLVGGGRVDAIDHLAGRAAIRLAPTEAVDLVFTIDGERDRDDSTAGKSITFPVAGDPHFGQPREPLALNAPIRNDRDKYGVTLRGEFDLGDYSLTTISAARGYVLRYLEDTDGTPMTQLHYQLREEQDALSQEVRLNSPADRRVSWFIGASIYQEDVSARSTAIYDEDAICTGLAGVPFAIDCDTVLRLTPSPDSAFASTFDLLVALGAISDPYTGATGLSETNLAVGDYLSWGVYGDLTFRINDQWELIAGARYSRDRKKVRLSSAPVLNTITLINGGNVFLRAGQQSASESWGQAQPRLVLNYKPTRDLTAYASYTRGYKSGGFNVLQPGDPAFAPETVDQVEIGAKGALFDRRVQYELAAYNWRYTDLQVQVFEGGLPVVRNAGEARGWGFDGSVTAQVTSALELTAAISLLDAEYRRFSPAPGLDYAGNRLALSPEVSGRIGAGYTQPLAGGELRLRADYSYQSDVFFSPDNGPLRQDAFGLWSGRIAYAFPNDKVELALRGENLSDEHYATSGQAIGAINLGQLRLGHPRLYAIELNYRW